eukprot:gene8182-9625_t
MELDKELGLKVVDLAITRKVDQPFNIKSLAPETLNNQPLTLSFDVFGFAFIIYQILVKDPHSTKSKIAF